MCVCAGRGGGFPQGRAQGGVYSQPPGFSLCPPYSWRKTSADSLPRISLSLPPPPTPCRFPAHAERRPSQRGLPQVAPELRCRPSQDHRKTFRSPKPKQHQLFGDLPANTTAMSQHPYKSTVIPSPPPNKPGAPAHAMALPCPVCSIPHRSGASPARSVGEELSQRCVLGRRGRTNREGKKTKIHLFKAKALQGLEKLLLGIVSFLQLRLESHL